MTLTITRRFEEEMEFHVGDKVIKMRISKDCGQAQVRIHIDADRDVIVKRPKTDKVHDNKIRAAQDKLP